MCTLAQEMQSKSQVTSDSLLWWLPHNCKAPTYSSSLPFLASSSSSFSPSSSLFSSPASPSSLSSSSASSSSSGTSTSLIGASGSTPSSFDMSWYTRATNADGSAIS